MGRAEVVVRLGEGVGRGVVVGKACCGEGRLSISVAVRSVAGGVFDKVNW